MENSVIERVRKVCDVKSKNPREFSASIRVTYNTFLQQYKGERSVSMDVVSSILSTFEDISSEWLLRGEGSMYRNQESFLDKLKHRIVEALERGCGDWQEAQKELDAFLAGDEVLTPEVEEVLGNTTILELAGGKQLVKVEQKKVDGGIDYHNALLRQQEITAKCQMQIDMLLEQNAMLTRMIKG